MQIIFEQFIDNVFRFALSLSGDRHLAEDLTQECFLRAHQRQAQLQSGAAAKSWLFQIMANLWKDYLKKKRITLVEAGHLDGVAGDERPDVHLVQQEQVDDLVRIMQTLPGRQRSVLFLSAVEQMTNGQISNLLEMSQSSVKSNLSIARKAMRKKILEQTEGVDKAEAS